MRVEESADQHVGLARTAMVRAPVQALQFRFGRHGGDVGKGGAKRKAGSAPLYAQS